MFSFLVVIYWFSMFSLVLSIYYIIYYIYVAEVISCPFPRSDAQVWVGDRSTTLHSWSELMRASYCQGQVSVSKFSITRVLFLFFNFCLSRLLCFITSNVLIVSWFTDCGCCVDVEVWHVSVVQVYLWETSGRKADSEYDSEWSGLLPPWDGPSCD